MKNKFIVEALGHCWHEWEMAGTEVLPFCMKCSPTIPIEPHNYNPDLTTPDGFFWMWEEMQKRDDWLAFLACLSNRKIDMRKNIKPFDFINPPVFRDAVYEYLNR